MKRLRPVFWIVGLAGAIGASAGTNNGTISTTFNGFSTLKECESSAEPGCVVSRIDALSGVLDLATTGQCLASLASLDGAGLRVPACPKTPEDLRGLDNTHPTAGLFAIYYGANDNFIFDLAKNYLSSSSAGKFNLILPLTHIESLKANKQLTQLLNNERVNIIDVATMPKVKQWAQDSFQFATKDGAPALYQLEHNSETKSNYEERLACELAKKCDIPYYVPSSMVGETPTSKEFSGNLNSGGNLEVLPGGTFYRGILKTDGLSAYQPKGESVPYQTPYQAKQRKALDGMGNRVLDLDVSFLKVGHVDEIFNVVKTNAPAPCNFAVMMASPAKAVELMEKAAREVKPKSPSRCQKFSYKQLKEGGRSAVLTDAHIKKIYENMCFDNVGIEAFVASDEFRVLKEQNLSPDSPAQIARIMKENQALLAEELKRSSGCQKPEFIPVPVLFRDGLSYAPDLVNGVVESPPGSASTAILPRTFFEPFDSYIQAELGRHGVKTMLTYDMMYHLMSGEVHCGTNDARVCRP